MVTGQAVNEWQRCARLGAILQVCRESSPPAGSGRRRFSRRYRVQTGLRCAEDLLAHVNQRDGGSEWPPPQDRTTRRQSSQWPARRPKSWKGWLVGWLVD
jgi:hypothetical protein